MEAFGFTDRLDEGRPRRALARITLLPRHLGGRDLAGGFGYRPNHNFGAPEDRAFYIGQIEVPAEGLQAGESGVMRVTFLSGPGLDDVLRPGRRWRIQEGPRCVANGEVLEVEP